LLEQASIELLWISSINNNFLKCGRVVRSAGRTRTVMALHNLNHWLGGPPWQLAIQPWRGWLSRRWLLGAMDGVCVLEEGLAEGLRDLFGYRKPIFVLPGLTFEDALLESPPEDVPTRFVVPGAIEAKRRDYHLVLDALEVAWAEDHAVALALLGAPQGQYGKEVLARCAALQERGVDVQSYSGFVPQGQFHRGVKEAHVLLAPIQVETRFAGTREVYGRAKSSGTVGDVIRYARPGLVPEALRVDPALEGAFLRYAGREGFIDRVVALTANRRERTGAIAAAHRALAGYSPAACYARVQPALRRFIVDER
jgi:hypothetical protein